MWRRHGSVYKTRARTAAAAADPYEAVREALSKHRRQELFSFAAAQLLVMGTPERAALLLRWDIGHVLHPPKHMQSHSSARRRACRRWRSCKRAAVPRRRSGRDACCPLGSACWPGLRLLSKR